MTPEERRAAAEHFRATGQRPLAAAIAPAGPPDPGTASIPPRVRALQVAGDYWWLFALAALAGAWLTDLPIFRYAIWAVGIPLFLLIAFPVLLYAFSPLFGLFASLRENFSASSGATGLQRWFWVPLSLVAASVFAFAQVVLAIWSFIVTFAVWQDVVGGVVAAIAMLFFGLTPIAMILAPFVALVNDGWTSFGAIVAMFLMLALWPLLGRIAFSEGADFTIERALGYSPQLFLLGALGFQVLAMALFTLGFSNGGEAMAGIGGGVSLLLALVASISWMIKKRQVTEAARSSLYRPSVWIYVLGFFVTNVLAAALGPFTEELATISWLNVIFLFGMVARGVGLLMSGRRAAAAS